MYSMSKIFSEHELNDIIEYWDKNNPESAVGLIQEYLMDLDYDPLPEKVLNAALALANPSTRDIARSKYVQEDERYYWIRKNRANRRSVVTLVSGKEEVELLYIDNNFNINADKLSENNIIESGFDPNRFYKFACANGFNIVYKTIYEALSKTD